MAASTDAPTTLDVTSRAAEGSRSARRLRRTGRVPGVIYGGDGEPQLFAGDGRILRNTLAQSGAILQVTVDGGDVNPVLVKDVQRHPVLGEAVHVDLPRLGLNVAIPTTLPFDVSTLQINDTATLGQLTAPAGVTLLDDPDTVIATVTPPTVEPVADEIETEVEVVGEGESAEVAEKEAEGDTGEEAEQSAS